MSRNQELNNIFIKNSTLINTITEQAIVLCKNGGLEEAQRLADIAEEILEINARILKIMQG
jgi:hypothetical protein